MRSNNDAGFGSEHGAAIVRRIQAIRDERLPRHFGTRFRRGFPHSRITGLLSGVPSAVAPAAGSVSVGSSATDATTGASLAIAFALKPACGSTNFVLPPLAWHATASPIEHSKGMIAPRTRPE